MPLIQEKDRVGKPHTYQVKESKIICNFLEIKELKERKK